MAVVVNDVESNRFVMGLPEGEAALNYEVDDGRRVLLHTGVPASAEGQGHGSALVRAALEHARDEGLRVVPLCHFARAWVEQHPEYGELVASER